MADIFLSYKKEDRAVAERLVEALRAAGKSVWWDDALNPHQAWDAMIEREIAASRVVIVLWTPHSVQSDWVRSEAHYAQDHGKLVPVMIERCTLPIAFMLRQAVDLASGVFDTANPQWVKLLGWIEGVSPEVGETNGQPAEATVTTSLAAVPVKALTRERWLGPARRPVVALGVGALVVALLAVLFLLRSSLGLGKEPQPAVVVDPFTAHAVGLPAGFAESLSNEMFTGFSSSSRISPVNGDGTRHLQAYQLSGDISTEGDKILVIAKLFAPDIEAPITTIKLDQPRANPVAAREFGLHLSEFTRCVTTASDNLGAKLFVLPVEAMGAWGKYCQQINSGTPLTTAESVVTSLRNVVAAAPKFANGWSSLSEYLFFSAFSPGANKAVLLAESTNAADLALSIDPTTARAYAFKANLVAGLAGNPNNPSLLGRIHDFAAWEALAEKSIHVRPSDCFCELPIYANTLNIFGRMSAAQPLLQQAYGIDTEQVAQAIPLADLLASTGNPTGGARILDELAETWPDNQVIPAARFAQALWRRDWKAARISLAGLPDNAAKAAFPALIDALKSGDAARIHAAGAPFLAINANPDTISPASLWALALSGYDDQAVDALAAVMGRKGMNLMSDAYRPPFVNVRKTPRFAALAERMGLFDYWRMPGHRPDFCNEPMPAALCANVSKS